MGLAAIQKLRVALDHLHKYKIKQGTVDVLSVYYDVQLKNVVFSDWTNVKEFKVYDYYMTDAIR